MGIEPIINVRPKMEAGPMKDIDLQTWLIRMSQGAFQVVYESTKAHTYKLIYYLAPNKQEVGDIMSEVYMQLFKSLENYDYEKNFSSWFNGLIVYQVRNWKRRSWRRFRIFEKLVSVASDKHDYITEDRMKVINDRLDLMPILETLSQKLKEVIVLKYYQDYSYEDIAKLLIIPVGTVKSRHHLALKQLRSQFDRQTETGREKEYVY